MVEVNTIKSIHPGWRVAPARDKPNNKNKDQRANAEEARKSKNAGNSDIAEDGHSHIDDYV